LSPETEICETLLLRKYIDEISSAYIFHYIVCMNDTIQVYIYDYSLDTVDIYIYQISANIACTLCAIVYIYTHSIYAY
jgi:hypothetical protein